MHNVWFKCMMSHIVHSKEQLSDATTKTSCIPNSELRCLLPKLLLEIGASVRDRLLQLRASLVWQLAV